jgi:hypothetical protein
MSDPHSNDEVCDRLAHKAPSEGATGTGTVFIVLFYVINSVMRKCRLMEGIKTTHF